MNIHFIAKILAEKKKVNYKKLTRINTKCKNVVQKILIRDNEFWKVGIHEDIQLIVIIIIVINIFCFV